MKLINSESAQSESHATANKMKVEKIDVEHVFSERT